MANQMKSGKFTGWTGPCHNSQCSRISLPASAKPADKHTNNRSIYKITFMAPNFMMAKKGRKFHVSASESRLWP